MKTFKNFKEAAIEALKKIVRFIKFHDWTWAVLITFFAYLIINIGPPIIFNIPMAYFAINWLQPLIATAGILSGLFAIARLGQWFNFRKLHDYTYGEKNKNPEGTKFINFSFFDFKQITPWQRLLISLLSLAFLFASALLVFLRFIPLNAPA